MIEPLRRLARCRGDALLNLAVSCIPNLWTAAGSFRPHSQLPKVFSIGLDFTWIPQPISFRLQKKRRERSVNAVMNAKSKLHWTTTEEEQEEDAPTRTMAAAAAAREISVEHQGQVSRCRSTVNSQKQIWFVCLNVKVNPILHLRGFASHF